jgi:invasion protein IalB
MRYIWVLLAGLFALFGAVYASSAAAQNLTSEQFKDWTIRCQAIPESRDKLCEMIQSISQNTTGKTLAQIALGRKDSNSPWLSFLLVPLGVDIPFGVYLVHENGLEDRAMVVRCTNAGCRARWSPNDASIAAMKAGSASQLVFRNIENKAVRIPLSMSGFTAALAKLQQD